MGRSKRLMLHGADSVPELDTFGYDELKVALDLKEHDHGEAYEFVWVEKGRAIWEVGGALYESSAGEVFHTRPGERHKGGYEIIQPCTFWWLILKRPTSEARSNESWLGLPADEGQAIMDRLANLPRVVRVGREPCGPLERLMRTLPQPGRLNGLQCRMDLIQFLLILIKPRGKESPESIEPSVQRMADRIREHPSEPHDIAAMAADCGVSLTHFYRQFQKITGFSPKQYIDHIRISEACRRLEETDQTITDMAMELQFATSQHFATVFKRIFGRTPSEWRKTFGERS